MKHEGSIHTYWPAAKSRKQITCEGDHFPASLCPFSRPCSRGGEGGVGRRRVKDRAGLLERPFLSTSYPGPFCLGLIPFSLGLPDWFHDWFCRVLPGEGKTHPPQPHGGLHCLGRDAICTQRGLGFFIMLYIASEREQALALAAENWISLAAPWHKIR